MTNIVKFDFHGDELSLIQCEGEAMVVLARLCEIFEVDVGGQRRKIQALSWARWKIISAHDVSGREQDLFCINIKSVAGWLFTLNAGKVAPHLREKLAIYQGECAEVLADHFLGKRRGPMDPDAAAIERTRLSHLEALTHGHARQINQIFGWIGRHKQLGAFAPAEQQELFRGPPDAEEMVKLTETAIGRKLGKRERTILVALVTSR